MNQIEIKRRQIETCSHILGLVTLWLFGRITGDNGVTYMAAALEGFQIIWLLTGGAVADALGRMVRGRNARGQHKNVEKLKKNMLLYQSVVGALGCVLLLILARPLAAKIFHAPYSEVIIMILAPAVLFRNVAAVFLGYFQGEGTQLPTLLTCLLRRIFVLGLGLLLCRALEGYGKKVSALLAQEAFAAMYGGMGVAAAVSLTEGLILLFLFILYRSRRGMAKNQSGYGMRSTDSFSGSIQILYRHTGMHTMVELLKRLPLWIGIILYQGYAAKTEGAADYGIFYGKYMVLCGGVTLFLCSMMIPLYVRTAGCYRREEMRYAKGWLQNGIHIGIVNGLFYAAFIAVMAEQLAQILNGEPAKLMKEMLQYGAFLIVFLVLDFFLLGVLTLMGRRILGLAALAVGNLAFVCTLIPMLKGGKLGLLAVVDALLVGTGICAVLMGALACMLLGSWIEWFHTLVLPVVGAVLEGLVCMLLGKVLTPHLGPAVTVLVCFVLSFLAYWTLLILCRNFNEQDLRAIPGGRLILAAGQMLHVF